MSTWIVSGTGRIKIKKVCLSLALKPWILTTEPTQHLSASLDFLHGNTLKHNVFNLTALYSLADP